MKTNNKHTITELDDLEIQPPQKLTLVFTEEQKSICLHDWKIISFYSYSCSWICKKCRKTII